MIYLILFLEFFKIGLFCFGGAFGMIPLIEETVLRHEWLTQAQFYDLIGICESTPGPIAVNMATYIGSVQGGLPGSLVATTGIVLPSFMVILFIASVTKNLTDNRYFSGFIKGVQPVVAALIISTGLILLVKTLILTNNGQFCYNLNLNPISVVVFLFLAGVHFFADKILKKKISSVQLILISALLGIVLSIAAEQIKTL